MLTNPLVSIVLPVYNRSEYLEKAIDSVITQTYQNWELIIADDASDLPTQEILNRYALLPNIKILRNAKNLGLFPNLNQAIRQTQGLYAILLCSDDFLLPHCLESSVKLMTSTQYDASLILTAFNQIDSNGIEISSLSVHNYENHYNLTSSIEQMKPNKSVPLLLQAGSVNGNLTGMCFKKDIFEQIGGFREDWKHAADWEWIYRVCCHSNILFSKTPIATVRSHSLQLSGVNFENISNSLEVIEMVKTLFNDSHLIDIEESKGWVLIILQSHLWFALKFIVRGEYDKGFKIIRAINQVTGLNQTLFALIKWLPNRWQAYTGKQQFPLHID